MQNTLNSIPLTPVEKKREEDVMNSFDLVAGDDGEIDAWELKKIITLMFTKGRYCYLCSQTSGKW